MIEHLENLLKKWNEEAAELREEFKQIKSSFISIELLRLRRCIGDLQEVLKTDTGAST